MMVTIGIIDKDQKSRESLISILENGEPDKIIGEKPFVYVNFSSDIFNPAAIRPEESHPDIVLIDIEGQEMDSIRSIRTRFPETRIIVVSNSLDTATVLESYRNGAANFVQKSTVLQYLFFAIHSTMENTSPSPEFHPNHIRNN